MIRVLIYVTNSIMAAGLASIISADANFELVATATNLAMLRQLEKPPDVLLLEWSEEESELLTQDIASGLTVIAFSTTNQEVNEALALGVQAFLPLSATTEEITAAITAAAAGLVVLHPELADLLIPSPIVPFAAEATEALTPREVEVLQMLALGLGNKAIANSLHISEHTVKFHLSSIFAKLQASSRTEAVTLGLRQGLIML